VGDASINEDGLKDEKDGGGKRRELGREHRIEWIRK
jgi:hypothetical protein